MDFFFDIRGKLIILFLNQRCTLSVDAISEIGPIEKNFVVEKNKKNFKFMRAWEECLFIVKTLFAPCQPYKQYDNKESLENNEISPKSTPQNVFPQELSVSIDNPVAAVRKVPKVVLNRLTMEDVALMLRSIAEFAKKSTEPARKLSKIKRIEMKRAKTKIDG